MVLFKRGKSAFTLVELMVTIAIIAILAALALISFNGVQRTSRDARRRSDIKTYAAALEKYRITSGTYAVTGKNNEPTGYKGLGFGRMNQVVDSSGTNTMPNGQNNAARYVSLSIVQALKDRGYIGTIATNPSNPKNLSTLDDYTLIRCDKRGNQSFTKDDESFSLLAIIERDRTPIETENVSHGCMMRLSQFDEQKPVDYGTTNSTYSKFLDGSTTTFRNGPGPGNLKLISETNKLTTNSNKAYLDR